MGWLKERIIELLTPAQCGDETARLGLLTLSMDVDSRSVSEIISIVADYRLRGWATVPQLPGAKQPCIKWKPYQSRLPTVDELIEWWTRWHNAGIAVVLGPVSGLLAIDVDGAEAHAALAKHLGNVPKAPKSISGSGKPFRYHLFFRHPAKVATNAKFCPWHPTLEFRGHGGIVVLPPSRHKSGGLYRWADGASINEIELPEVPRPILRELQARGRRRARLTLHVAAKQSKPLAPYDRRFIRQLGSNVAWETRLFLDGEYANGPDWNCRLFRAACDLAGNGVPQETATRLLLAGAEPWNNEETERALVTIQSAYSENRYAARRRKK
jgi:hypothetical protein